MKVLTTKKTIKKDLTLATVEVTIMAIKLNNKAFTKTVFNQIPEIQPLRSEVEMIRNSDTYKEKMFDKKYSLQVLNALGIQKVIGLCTEKKAGKILEWFLVTDLDGELRKICYSRSNGRYVITLPYVYHFQNVKRVYYAV